MTFEEINALRQRVVDEAISWVGTPYIPEHHLKGFGCDCATIIAEVLIACGVIEREEIGHYGIHWWANAKEEKYMFRVIRHAQKTIEGISNRELEAKPGDIVLARVVGSRVFNHAGLVVKWPLIVDAIVPKARRVNAAKCCMWVNAEVAVFNPFHKFEVAACSE